MRSLQVVFVTLLLTNFVFAQINTEKFALKGQMGFGGKEESIIQPIPLNNGSKLLIVGKNRLQFWDIASGKLIGESPHKIRGFWDGGLGFLRRMINFTNEIEVSQDGKRGILAAKAPGGKSDRERQAVVWNLEAGEQMAVLDRPSSPLRLGTFSENGSTILTIHGDLKEAELSFWNTADFTHRAAIKVRDLSFQQLSRNGEHVFIGSAKANKWLDYTLLGFESARGIEVWNTRTGQLEKTYTDGDIKFWNTLNPGPAVGPDEKYMAARSEGNKIVVWETAGDGNPKYYVGDGDPKKKLRLVGISDDSRYLLAARDEEALVYELETGKLYRTFRFHWGYDYKLSPDSRYATYGTDGWVSVYDLENNKTVSSFSLRTSSGEDRTYALERPALSPDGKYMMIYGFKEVRIYDVANGKLVQTLVDPQRAKYKDSGKIKDNGLDNRNAGWLAGGDSIYVFGDDKKSFYLWNKK